MDNLEFSFGTNLRCFARYIAFLYTYDFGDGWTHSVILEDIVPVEPDTKYPRVVDGAQSCPPEDCGGPYGYADLLEILAKPRHKEHRQMRE